MRRRELIAAVLAAACAPFSLMAQPAAKLHRIGWLDYSSAAENLGIFVQAMTALGWQEGKTFRVECRGGPTGHPHRTAVATQPLHTSPHFNSPLGRPFDLHPH